MKTLNIVQVKKNGYNKVDVTYINNNGVERNVTRTVRKHTKEIRALASKGVYCFEIAGILYWYNVQKGTNIMVQYKEPEDFRSEERKGQEAKSNGRTSKEESEIETTKTSVEVEIPKVEKKAEPKEEVKAEEFEEEVKHSKYNTIKTCIENDIPVFLVGEAGTGKSHTLEDISWDLGLPFYSTNSVQQEYKLTGFIDAGGKYHETEFYKAFKNGGIFFLDEMDASIEEVLVLLNTAIANKYFEFPTGRIYAHKDFRVVSAGNTVGSGADELYTGRRVLDQSTLDRFVTIPFDYDRNIELSISKGNSDLVDFVRDMRQQAKDNGIRATFSYRCISMVTKLESLLPLNEIMQIAVFKGMDKDTVNCFRANGTNKYYKALEEYQR